VQRLRLQHGDPEERYRAYAHALCTSINLALPYNKAKFEIVQIPEVKAVEQIISQEEAIAADEFAKFEARLREGGKTVEI
jgi:hypothetical protein